MNIDFEGITSSQAANFRTFVFDLGTSLKAISKELVVHPVDWSSVYISLFTVNSVVDFTFDELGYFYMEVHCRTGAPLTGRTYCVENSVRVNRQDHKINGSPTTDVACY
ncbi:MAG: hypothetical protein IPI19_19275 [Ignavibacteriales bacterium]|nr:hypothetical protein [Ignavibacteriales bacterium]